MNRYALLLIFLISFNQPQIVAQISIAGLADFELRMAGEDSSPLINQTPNESFSIYTPNLRLFISGNISERWFVSSVLQSDHYEGENLSTPFFSVFNINWTPELDSPLLVTAGRFVTPYGLYSDRFLSSQNPFIHLPLSHASALPVSKRFGHLSEGFTSPEMFRNNYGEGENGMTMVYTRMYTQGFKLAHTFGESEWLHIDVAATLTPASTHLDYGKYDNPAITGRLVFQPVIWAKLGFSYSDGTFLQEDAANDSLLIYDISSYKQTLMGADLTFNYRYYTLMVEWNNSFWKAPFYDPGTSNSDQPQTGLATVNHFSGEVVVDLPFIVGGYVGLRYEQMEDGEIEVYQRDNSDTKINQTFSPWTYSRNRLEFAAGYKLQRNITLKGSYLYSDDNGPDLDDNVFALQLSVLF